MIEPSYCPCCKDPLLNSELNYSLYKICKNRLDHTYEYTCSNPKIISNRITSQILHFGKGKKFSAKWLDGYLFIQNQDGIYNHAGFYIEPDFSNYKKLISKLKTYITFS